MKNTINIVIDTNVLLSALYSNKGASYKLLSIIDSDKFNVNISTTLIYEYEKISLNQFIVNALSEKVSALQTLDIIEQKAQKASKKDFLNALAQIPDNEPYENDRL